MSHRLSLVVTVRTRTRDVANRERWMPGLPGQGVGVEFAAMELASCFASIVRLVGLQKQRMRSPLSPDSRAKTRLG